MVESNDIPQQPSESEPTDTSRYASWRDAWVAELVKEDLNKIPDLLLLCGFIANLPDDKALRLFSDPQLRQCIDIPIDAILHRQEIPKSISPLGGSYLWIKRTSWPECKQYTLGTNTIIASGEKWVCL